MTQVADGLGALFDQAGQGDVGAAQRLEQHFKTAHPEPDDAGVPPTVDHYVLPQGYADAPNLAGQLTAWAHASGIGVSALASIASQVERLAEHYSHLPEAASEAVLEGMGKHTIEELSRTAGGRETLTRARDAWSRLESSNPGLASALNDLGASCDPEFIELLARTHKS